MDDSEQNRMATMPTCTSCFFLVQLWSIEYYAVPPLAAPYMQSLPHKDIVSNQDTAYVFAHSHTTSLASRKIVCSSMPSMTAALPFFLFLLPTSVLWPVQNLLSQTPSPTILEPQHVSPLYCPLHQPPLLILPFRSNTPHHTRKDAPSLGFA